MRVDYAFLAQAADLNPGGTFSVLSGGMDTVEVDRVPGLVPMLSAIVQIAAEGEEELGEHKLRIWTADPHGTNTNIFPEFPFDLKRGLEHPEAEARFVCLVNLQGLSFASAGLLQIRFDVDGQTMKSLPLWIRPAKKEEAA